MSKGSLLNIKKRIGSVQSINGMSKALELVSSAKFKKMQQQALMYKDFVDALSDIFTATLPEKLGQGSIYIVIGSDQGMNGSFNTNVYRALIGTKISGEIIVFGSKAREVLNKKKISYTYLDLKNYNEEVDQLSQKVSNAIFKGEVGSVKVLYTKYSKGRLNVVEEEFLSKQDVADFEYEPSAKKIYSSTLDFYIKHRILETIVSSIVSDNYSRMVAMKNAYDNSKDLIESLQLKMNKERQSLITQEILEVVNGAEGMGGF